MKAVPANRYFLFFAIVIAGCAVDLMTKRAVFDWLGMPGQRDTWWVLPDVLGFQTSLNAGALFGMGQGMVRLFALLSLLAAGSIAAWLYFGGASWDLLLTVALGMITAGILGNLYDRLGMPGLEWHDGLPVYAVRDWILVMIGKWPWPTFNIADSLLVCGAGLLVWHAFRKDAAGRQPTAEGA
jgi:signal peptidase II